MLIPETDPIPTLLQLIQDWKPDLSAQHRLSPSAIPEFVPPPLRSIYELAGDYPIPHARQWRRPDWVSGLFANQDRLEPPDRLELQEGRFTFIWENQGVWSCQTLGYEDDPPVFADERTEGEFEEVCTSLSQFLTTFCLQELVFGAEIVLYAEDVVDPRDLVRADLEEIWLEGKYVFPIRVQSFYRAGDVLIMWVDGMYFCGMHSDDARRDLSASIDFR